VSELFRVEQGNKSYQEQSLLVRQPAKQVLFDISLTIQAGESVALVGASGSGKSTLCRMLLGLETFDSGNVLFKGLPLSDFSAQDEHRFRRAVQMVFQDSVSAVNPRLTIANVIEEPLKYLMKMPAGKRPERVRELLSQVGLLPEDAFKKAGQMSGGMLQRVCIARALACEPDVIALDESLSSLDLVLQQQLIALLKQIQKEQGTSYLFVTHDLRLVHLFCQRALVMDQGRLVEDTLVSRDMQWQSDMGQALQKAVLPARPRRKAALA